MVNLSYRIGRIGYAAGSAVARRVLVAIEEPTNVLPAGLG